MRCKENVVLWIACLEFLFDGYGEIIVEIFCLPIAARQAEGVIREHAIDVNYGVLRCSEGFLTDKR